MNKKILTALIFILLFVASQAQLINPFTVRKTITQKGGIIYLSNTSSKAIPDNIVQNEAPPAGTGYDNNFTNTYVDIDGDATTWMSSSDQLNLPTCSEISWAGLYWGADCSTGDENFATRSQVKLKVNSGAYVALTADYLKDNTVGYKTYHCFKDITSIVSANSLTARYTIANMAGDISGTNLFGGWTIVVVYKNNTMSMRNLTVFDGLANVSSGTYSTVDIPISGFQTPLSGPITFELGLVVYDGDRSLTGDQLLFKGATSFVNLSDALHNTSDIFNSTIARNGSLTPLRNPSYNNTLGYDANIFSPNNSTKNYIGNNAISATIRQTTGGETFLTQVVTSAIDVYEPDLRSAVRVKNITSPSSASANPGDVLEYTINGLNIGSDPSINTYVTDTIERNATYIAGSIKVSFGATTGAMTDAAGDDLGEYIASSRAVRVRIGSGANAFTGGLVNNSPVGSDSTEFSFRVQISTDCAYMYCDNVVNNSSHIIGTGNISGNIFDNRSNPGIFDAYGCPLSGSTASPINTSGCTAPTASANAPVCQGGTINFTATYSPSATYLWTGPNGFTSTLQSPSITNLSSANAGTYTANIYITGTTCHFTYPLTAEIAIANAGPDQIGASTCGINPLTLAGNTPTNSTGVWSIISGAGGSFGSGHTATSTVANSTFNGVAGNTYVLRWSLSSTGCATTTDDVTLTFSQSPSSATLSATSVTCANHLNVAITGGSSPYTLVINNGVGTISNYISGTDISVNPISSTTYTLTSVVGANGCTVTSIPTNTATINVSSSIGTGTITAVTAATEPVVTAVGPKYPTSVTNGSVTNPWTSPGNATSSNASYASFTTSGSTSAYLNATNFGFAIPSNATIRGIVLEIQKRTSSTSSGKTIKDASVILYGGTGTSIDKKSASSWSSSLSWVTYGGATDLWGMTWTPAQINSSSFGAGLTIVLTSNPKAYVDAFRITVYYTSPTSLGYCDNLSSAAFSATGFSNVTTYTWTPPTGASIISGQGTSSVTFNFNGAGQSGNYWVLVTPSNACGAGTPVSLTIAIVDCANATPYCVKGNVYWDINGSTSPAMVDGTGIGSVNSTPLYVTIARTSSTTTSFATTPVNSDGSWEICNATITSSRALRVTLSKNNYATGTSQGSVLATLPSGCSNNGEIANTITNSTAGNDNTIDGVINFSTPSSLSNNIVNLNFGLKITTPPVANNNTTSTNEDTPITFNITNNDVDADGTIAVSTVILSTASSNGTWTVSATGGVTYTPTANFNGTASITYTVKDNETNISNSATITVTVTAINDPPVATASSVTTPENTNYTFASSNFLFTDVESNAMTSITIVTLPALGTLTCNGIAVNAGDVITTANIVNLIFIPETNQHASPYTTFTFNVNDANLGTVAGTMTVNVTHVNVPPVAIDDATTTNQNTAVAINILTNDTNADGTIVNTTVDLDPLTSGQQTTITIPGQGTFTNNGTGTITFTPLSGFYGTVTEINYTVNNSLSLTSNVASIIITVKPAGAPVAVNDAATTNINTSVTFSLTNNDTDDGTINVSRVDLDPITPGIQQSLYVTDQGQFSVDMLGFVTFTPDWNFDGVVTATYTVKDNMNFVSNTATITVTVVWSNVKPFAVDDFASTNEDTPVSFNVTTNDYDLDDTHGNAGILNLASVDLNVSVAGIQTTYTVTGQGVFTVNNLGVVTFTPSSNFYGTVTPVGYTIKDLSGAVSDSASIYVTVISVNDAPIAVNDIASGAGTNTIGLVTLDITNNDTDIDGTIDFSSVDLDPFTIGQQSSFTVSGQGTYTIDLTSGILTFTYTFATPNTALIPIQYTVNDNNGLVSNFGTITITILPLGNPFAGDDDFTINEDTPGSYNLATNDVDEFGTNPGIDATKIILIGSLTSASGTWSFTDTTNLAGFITFTPAANYFGSASLNYTIKDGDGNLSNQAVITVTILPVNDAPSFTKGADQNCYVNTGVHIIDSWATLLSKGPSNESTQILSFEMTNDNNGLFSSQPSIDTLGNLAFALAINQTGMATVTVKIRDDGGTANGGVDVSVIQTFRIYVTAPLVPLPISLTTFYAVCENQNIILNWQTASETNSNYFIIEKSNDCTTWTELGKVTAHGSSVSTTNYTFEDYLGNNYSVNYYRLIQVDFDGNRNNFNSISSDCNAETTVTNTLKVYPNPSSDKIYINFSSFEIQGSAEISIVDAKGAKVYSKNVLIKKGNNMFLFEGVETSEGIYYVQISNKMFRSNAVKHIFR